MKYHNFRLIQSVYSMLKSTSGKYQDSFQSTVHTKGSNEQSILEMASINSSMAKETLDLAQNVLPAFSLAETSLLLTHESQETREKLQMEPTSAEKLALQVKLVMKNFHQCLHHLYSRYCTVRGDLVISGLFCFARCKITLQVCQGWRLQL